MDDEEQMTDDGRALQMQLRFLEQLQDVDLTALSAERRVKWHAVFAEVEEEIARLKAAISVEGDGGLTS